MTSYPRNLDPILVERLISSGGGSLTKKMNIEFIELSGEHSVAQMPIVGNAGLDEQHVHRGAFAVLGESLGSISPAIYGGPSRIPGIEINASHSENPAIGPVTGVCTLLYGGPDTVTHEVVVSGNDGQRLSTVRITNYLKSGSC